MHKIRWRLLVVFLVIGALFFGLVAVQLDDTNLDQQYVNYPDKSVTNQVDSGILTVVSQPATRFTLADGQTILASNGYYGPFGAPQIHLPWAGDNEPFHSEQVIDLYDRYTFINGSHQISLQVLDCKQGRHVDGDVSFSRIDSCRVKVSNTQVESAEFTPISFSQEMDFSELTNQTLGTYEPYKFVVDVDANSYFSIPFLEMIKSNIADVWLVNGKGEMAWKINFFSGYGKTTLSFSAEEIIAKGSKFRTLGPITVAATVEDMECEMETRGKTEYEICKPRVTVTVNSAQESNFQVVKYSTEPVLPELE